MTEEEVDILRLKGMLGPSRSINSIPYENEDEYHPAPDELRDAWINDADAHSNQEEE